MPTRIAPGYITSVDLAPGTVPSPDPRDNGGTGSTSGDIAPSEFAIITAAAYSAKNITGSADWIDITTNQPHGLVVGDKVTVYGLNNSNVNANGTYIITEVASSTQFRYSVGLTGYYASVVALNVSVDVTQRSATLTEGTLVLSTVSHGFNVGDVITVAGVDDLFNGTFLISVVNGSTIKYKFITAISSAISITSSTGTVDAVSHKYAIIGDTWIDTSITPNTSKIWDGLSWQSGTSLPDGIIVNDHMAPKPPTNLSATTNGYYDSSSGQPAVAVTLTWDAPTQNANDTALTDLAGYQVFYRYISESITGDPTGTVGVDPSGQLDTPGSSTNSDGKVSGTFTWNNTFVSTIPTITMATSAGTLTTPATFKAGLGKGSILWEVSGLSDGESFDVTWTSSGSNKYGAGGVSGTIGDSINYTQDASAPPTAGFTIRASIAVTSQTLPTATGTVGDIQSTTDAAPSAQWIAAGDVEQTSISMRDFSISSTVEFAVTAYDSSRMNFSVYSDALTVETGTPAIILSPPSTPSIEARMGTVTVSWDGYDNGGLQPPAILAYVEVHLGTTSGFTPSISTLQGRMERLGSNFLIVGDLTYGTTYYAKLIFVSTTGSKTAASSASTGALVVSLVDSDLVSKTLTTWPFQDGTVNLDALANNSVSASKIIANAVTQSAIAANAIGADQIIAGSIGAGKIAANAITANAIAANAITANAIAANAIEANKIKAGALDAFLITGAQIQTAKPLSQGGQNARIVLSSSGLYAYDSATGATTFSVDANTGTVTIGAIDTQINTVSNTANTASSIANTASNTATTANTAVTSLANNVYYTDPGTGLQTTKINGGNIQTGTISANVITTGVLTGVTVQTGASGTRVVMSGSDLSFYYGSTYVGAMRGSTNWGTAQLSILNDTATAGFYTDISTASLQGGSNFMAVSSSGATVRGNGTLWDFGGTITGQVSASGSLRVTGTGGITASTGPLTGASLVTTGSADIGSAGSGARIASTSYQIWGIGEIIDSAGAVKPRTSTGTSTAVHQSASASALTRSTSSRRYKVFEELLDTEMDILKLQPKTWIDKLEYEENNESIDGLKRYPGFIAEDLDDAGMGLFVYHNPDGSAESIDYGRLVAAIIPVLKSQQNEIEQLSARIKLLEEK